MAKEEHEEVKALRADWLQHQFTQSKIPAFRNEFNQALREFMGHASVSTDPKVAHAYQRFNSAYVMLSVFTKGTPEGKTLADLVAGVAS